MIYQLNEQLHIIQISKSFYQKKLVEEDHVHDEKNKVRWSTNSRIFLGILITLHKCQRCDIPLYLPLFHCAKEPLLIYLLISVKQKILVEEMCSKMWDASQSVGALKATLTWKKQHDWCRFVLVSFTNPFIYNTCNCISLIPRIWEKLKLHSIWKGEEGSTTSMEVSWCRRFYLEVSGHTKSIYSNKRFHDSK